MLLVILGKFLGPEWLHMTSACVCVVGPAIWEFPPAVMRLWIPSSPMLPVPSVLLMGVWHLTVAFAFPSCLMMLSIFHVCICHLYFLCDAWSAQILYLFFMGWLYYWVLNASDYVLLLLSTFDTGPRSDRCSAGTSFPSVIGLFILSAILSESRF